MTAPVQPRAMPVRWAIAFTVACAAGALAVGVIAGYEAGRDRVPRAARIFVESVKVPRSVSGTDSAWQIRWIEDGLPRIVQVDTDEARERIERALKR